MRLRHIKPCDARGCLDPYFVGFATSAANTLNNNPPQIDIHTEFSIFCFWPSQPLNSVQIPPQCPRLNYVLVPSGVGQSIPRESKKISNHERQAPCRSLRLREEGSEQKAIERYPSQCAFLLPHQTTDNSPNIPQRTLHKSKCPDLAASTSMRPTRT